MTISTFIRKTAIAMPLTLGVFMASSASAQDTIVYEPAPSPEVHVPSYERMENPNVRTIKKSKTATNKCEKTWFKRCHPTNIQVYP